MRPLPHSPPSGTVDRLFDEARLLREVEAAAIARLTDAGFDEVVLPLIERAEVFASQGAVRFVDRHGEVLGLRADFTGQVARLVSTRLAAQSEVKLCYRGVVFQDVDARSSSRRQLHQAGFELFDGGEVAGDIQVVRQALAVCDAVGVSGVRVSLGSAALIQALCPEADPSVRVALDRRDAGALPPSLLPLLELTGDARVLDQALRVLPAAARPALERLKAVAEGLGPDAARADIDLAEVRPWAYYSGMVFDLFAPGARGAVAGGGRYHGLAKRYGSDRAAVGASLDIDALVELRLQALRSTESTQPSTLVVALPKGRIRKSILRQLGPLGPNPEELETRKLVLEGGAALVGGQPASFLLVKDADIPEYVERGVADLGFVGLDVLSESPTNVLQPQVTQLGRCRMCLCGRPGTDLRELASRGTLRIASKYPQTARRHLDARGLPAEIIYLQGSVELGVVTGMADAIVDMVETGATLEANGLVVLEELMESTARAVVNRSAWRLKSAGVRALLERTGGAAPAAEAITRPSPAEFAIPSVRRQKPYTLTAPPEAPVKLNQNEAPEELSADWKDRLVTRFRQADWRRYPPFDSRDLREKLAAADGWRADGILIGNGSNELLTLLLRSIIAPGDAVVRPNPCFSLYPLHLDLAGARQIPVQLHEDRDFAYDAPTVEVLLEAARTAKVVLLTSPNNPTGSVLNRSVVERLLSETRALVVVDEAYREWCGQDFAPLLGVDTPLVLLRTLSKARAMAGLRFGYLMAAPSLCAELHKVSLPYPVNSLTQIAATALVAEPGSREELERRVERVTRERKALSQAIRAKSRRVIEGGANFILVSSADPPAELKRLLAGGVLVRDLSSSVPGYLRISIGTAADNRKLLELL